MNQAKTTSFEEPDSSKQKPHSKKKGLALILSVVFVFILLVSLGTWQVYRLHWKLDLIESVNQRISAAAVPVSSLNHLSASQLQENTYRHVFVAGTLLNEKSIFVQASTIYGGGFWMMTPLRADDGSVVLINQGFVTSPPARTPQVTKLSAAHETITGLLRLSEPEGGFLRKNAPLENRWYSRDVQAIGHFLQLDEIAPFFIDAEAPREGLKDPSMSLDSRTPIPGLTVVSFNNNHLVYALTWYSLALMLLAGCWWIKRSGY